MWFLVPGPYGATFISSLCFKPPYPESKKENVYRVVHAAQQVHLLSSLLGEEPVLLRVWYEYSVNKNDFLL